MININDLTAGYGKMVVLHNLSLKVNAGEIVCLIGPNGAGKSTVIRSIYGFTTIRKGKITYKADDITNLGPVATLKKGISYILQESGIFPEMTIEENLRMGGYLKNDLNFVKKRIGELYKDYPILAERRNKKAKILSGGERRMLELAKGLVLHPRILLLDEPSLGLAPKVMQEIFEKIRWLNSEGLTIMLVEQNAKKGLEVSDRGYVLASGQIKYEGSGEKLLKDEKIGRLYLGGN